MPTNRFSFLQPARDVELPISLHGIQINDHFNKEPIKVFGLSISLDS